MGFITPRSGVQVSPPLPTVSSTYGCRLRQPFFVCGDFRDGRPRPRVSDSIAHAYCGEVPGHIEFAVRKCLPGDLLDVIDRVTGTYLTRLRFDAVIPLYIGDERSPKLALVRTAS